MKIEIKKLPASQVQLNFEVPEEELQKFQTMAVKQVSEMIKVPGFRAGHVPLEILKKHVSEQAIESHMLDIAIPQLYGDAVVKEKLQVVSKPKIEIKGLKPLVFEAIVAVYPEVKVTGYENMNIKKNEVKVEDKDIEEVLKDVRKRRATYVNVDRGAKMGDKVEVDFEGFDDGGAAIENTRSVNHPIILGEQSLVPGFEEELVGLKVSDKKNFFVTFPQDYFHKKFQGKKVEFRVEMKKVEEIQLPEFTPEFLKEITGGTDDTLEMIKANIGENLRHDKEYGEKVRRENEFLDKLVEMTHVEVPEALIEEELDGMIDEMKSEMESKGITFDKYLEQTKKEVKDLREERRKEAVKRLTLRFGLHQLFEQEKIEVTPQELAHEIEHVISLYPAKEQYKVRKEYTEGSYLTRRLENKLRMDRLFEKFLK